MDQGRSTRVNPTGETNDAKPVPAEVDVCIVGSGPAGLTVAHELLGSGLNICLIESGALHRDPAAQELSAGVMDEVMLGTDLHETRLRQVGGNSNLWCIKIGRAPKGFVFGVRYAPFRTIDFERRPWVPHSGWPFGAAELRGAYRRATELTELGETNPEWVASSPEPLGLAPTFEQREFRFGPGAAFYERMRAAVDADPSCCLLPGHTAVSLEQDAGDPHVRRLQLRTSSGKAVALEARVFVLATGGIENARLLLASTGRSAAGLGNGHDMVGRGFMDHPLVHIGDLIPSQRAVWERAAPYDLDIERGPARQGYLTLGDGTMREHGLLDVGLSLFPRPSRRKALGIEACRVLAQAALNRQLPDDAATQARHLIRGLDGLTHALGQRLRGQSPLHGFGRGGWSTQPNNHRRYRHFEVMLQLEQAPDFDNRVTLSESLDRFGKPLPVVRGRIGELERHTLQTVRTLLSEQLELAGTGTLSPVPGEDGSPFAVPVSMAHHVGATRMGDSPHTSVVDADGRLHEVPNVFVTGSSTFPTSSHANPTLSIVALAARLGAHLARELGQAPEVAGARE